MKVYEVISCLSNNTFFCYLEKEKRNDTETLPIERLLNKEYLYEKIMQKGCIKR